MSGRQMSQSANFPGRQLSLQPNVQEPNVLGANCPERQLSGRQMSKAPNVGRQMSGRGLAGAICLPSPKFTCVSSIVNVVRSLWCCPTLDGATRSNGVSALSERDIKHWGPES